MNGRWTPEKINWELMRKLSWYFPRGQWRGGKWYQETLVACILEQILLELIL